MMDVLRVIIGLLVLALVLHELGRRAEREESGTPGGTGARDRRSS